MTTNSVYVNGMRWGVGRFPQPSCQPPTRPDGVDVAGSVATRAPAHRDSAAELHLTPGRKWVVQLHQREGHALAIANV
jgi:hypothetical protein